MGKPDLASISYLSPTKPRTTIKVLWETTHLPLIIPAHPLQTRVVPLTIVTGLIAEEIGMREVKIIREMMEEEMMTQTKIVIGGTTADRAHLGTETTVAAMRQPDSQAPEGEMTLTMAQTTTAMMATKADARGMDPGGQGPRTANHGDQVGT